MGWTYGGDPSEDRMSEVRFLVGDTNPLDKLVQDEEIEYILGQFVPTVGKPAWLAAAQVADGIAAKFARKAQRSVGSLSLAAQQQWEHYRTLAADLRALHATNGRGMATGFSGVPVAAPVLSGGGRTYLGGPSSGYSPEGDR